MRIIANESGNGASRGTGVWDGCLNLGIGGTEVDGEDLAVGGAGVRKPDPLLREAFRVGRVTEAMGGSVRSLRSVMFLRSLSALTFSRFTHFLKGCDYVAMAF